MTEPSVRAQVITRRSYNRPLNDEETLFETWEQTVDRVIGHQRWLWERAKDEELDDVEEAELEQLRQLMLERKVSLSGRTLWLGGTDVAKEREASQFNCSFLPQRTIHDIVDHIWLLLQGCGVGFKMAPGVLSGFARRVKEINVIRSDAQTKTGEDVNTEDYDGYTWTIRVGDSAEAWAKAFGKVLAGKYPAQELVFDLRPIRPGGYRLKGYGWISSGDGALSRALVGIANIMNRAAGRLLNKIELLDIGNWMGTVLSSRRSAEIALCDYDTELWEEFSVAKKDYWLSGNDQRSQSNNSILFWHKPSKLELLGMFQLMLYAGGSEPGFINAEHARRRAPWFAGVNPCAEILLGEHSFCNLVETDVAKFNGDWAGLLEAHFLVARANYRQTCVDLRDGILQDTWHELNEYLRLTGVGVTGVVKWEHWKKPEAWRSLWDQAHRGVNSMADELNLPHSKLVTTVKPSGCRPWYSLTTTSSGILTLEELFADHEDEQQWSDYAGGASVILDGESQPITKTFVNGEADVYKVTMSYGVEVESTGDHPWFVKGKGWVPAANIEVGDVVECKVGGYDNEVHAELKKVKSTAFKMRGDGSIITQPDHMDSDLAWLLGYLWGDGAMSPSKYRIRWTDENLDHLVKAARIIEEKFGVAPTLTQKLNSEASELTVASKHLWHWLLLNDVWKYAVDGLDVIPRVVRESSTDDVIAFIAGLVDSDGNVSLTGARKQILFSQKDEAFTVHLQHVAQACGIMFGRSHNTKGDNFQETKSMYLMTVSAHTLPEAGAALLSHSLKMQKLDDGPGFWIWENANRKFTLGKVKSVAHVGRKQTYDIEVGGDHWYYAGGVKSHNTLSKIMDTTEGVHAPLGRYIFNNVAFSVHDPLVKQLESAGYHIFDKPGDPDGVLVTLPVDFGDLDVFTKVAAIKKGHDGSEAEVEMVVNKESAVSQLERYKLLMDNYVDHNCSITVSYDPDEVPHIVQWLHDNWDSFVGVSWLLRADATKGAAELGYPYLPQEVVTASRYHEYVARLKPVELGVVGSMDTELDDDCATGACPVR